MVIFFKIKFSYLSFQNFFRLTEYFDKILIVFALPPVLNILFLDLHDLALTSLERPLQFLHLRPQFLLPLQTRTQLNVELSNCHTRLIFY